MYVVSIAAVRYDAHNWLCVDRSSSYTKTLNARRESTWNCVMCRRRAKLIPEWGALYVHPSIIGRKFSTPDPLVYVSHMKAACLYRRRTAHMPAHHYQDRLPHLVLSMSIITESKWTIIAGHQEPERTLRTRMASHFLEHQRPPSRPTCHLLDSRKTAVQNLLREMALVCRVPDRSANEANTEVQPVYRAPSNIIRAVRRTISSYGMVIMKRTTRRRFPSHQLGRVRKRWASVEKRGMRLVSYRQEGE